MSAVPRHPLPVFVGGPGRIGMTIGFRCPFVEELGPHIALSVFPEAPQLLAMWLKTVANTPSSSLGQALLWMVPVT